MTSFEVRGPKVDFSLVNLTINFIGEVYYYVRRERLPC